MFDITVLADPSARANFYVDHANDADFIERLVESVEAYADAHDLDKLPDELCGPVSATFAFAFLSILHTTPLEPIDVLVATSRLADNAWHAVSVHGDPVAAEVFNGCQEDITVAEAYSRLSAWVSATLWDDSDPDAFLASVAVLDMAEGPTLPDDVA